MALLFMDSFDHYATADVAAKWTGIYATGGTQAPAINATAGRRSSGALRTTGFDHHQAIGRVLPVSGATCVIGVAFSYSAGNYADLQVTANLDPLVGKFSSGSAALIYVRQGGANQITLRPNTNGTLSVYRGTSGAVLLGTSALALTIGQYNYLELKTVIDPTVGTVELRVDGAVWLSLTGQNTRATAVSGWDEIVIGHCVIAGTAVSETWNWDDLYVLDGSGAAPWNTFLGDCRVDARLPTAAGATTGWTPSAGANYAAVDDAAPNGDTDYVAASAAGLTDTYVTQDAPVSGATIYGIQHCLSAKKTDAGTATIAPVIRVSGADYVGADLSPSTTYAFLRQIAVVNPGTAAQWTEAGFNAAEFGYKRTT